MKGKARGSFGNIGLGVAMVVFLVFSALPAAAGGYANALKGVKGVKAVFNVSVGDPKMANVFFWAVRNVYQDKAAQGLPEKPQVAVVFHGPAVKLVTKGDSGFPKAERVELDKFHQTIRQMKKDGVKLEVCLYAAKVMGVDPATFMPEIDQVGNGFISVVGYQEQGYAMVPIP